MNNERTILDFSDYADMIEYCNQREDYCDSLRGRWYYCDDDTMIIYYGTFGNDHSPGCSFGTHYEQYETIEEYQKACKYWESQPEYDEIPPVDGEYQIDLGEGVETYECVYDDYYGIECVRATIGSQEFLLFDCIDSAGSAVRERWQDMAKNDKKEFICMLGEERLVQWALGDSDSFGIRSFEEFLDAVQSVPEEEIASYDSESREVDFSSDSERDRFKQEFGFLPQVAYRTN